MELATILGIGFLVLLIGFIGVPWLKKKGYINKESTQFTEQMLQLIGVILQNIDFESDKTKTQVETIFGVCEKVVKYVEQISVNDNNEAKKQLAINLTIGILEKMNVTLTDANKSLIEIGIESAVNALPKTKPVEFKIG